MTECAVPQFYTHHEPIARKVHRCCECGAPILKGEKHFSWTGKWEGQISSGRQHLVCMEACMMIRDEFEGGECIPFGGLMDYYNENRLELKPLYHPGWHVKVRDRVKRLRHLLAVILVRERKARRS